MNFSIVKRLEEMERIFKVKKEHLIVHIVFERNNGLPQHVFENGVDKCQEIVVK